MTEVLFYHLQNMALENVLPPLLEKSLERGWRCVVQSTSEERADALDAHLWTYRDDSFLPHAVAGDEADADQPILIAMDAANANTANVRFFVDRAVPQSVDGYDRIVYLFSGHDPDAVSEARVAWTALKAGNALTYWQQDENGRWVKKATA